MQSNYCKTERADLFLYATVCRELNGHGGEMLSALKGTLATGTASGLLLPGNVSLGGAA